MPKSARKKGKKIISLMALAALVLCGLALANQTDEELKKKYAVILGSYQFDMSDYEMGIVKLEVYVEYGSLWAYPDIADSAIAMTVIEGKEFSFQIEDPDEGTYVLEFLKDDEGNYSKCHVINEFAALDVTGTKIK
jgi:hypothetical protein